MLELFVLYQPVLEMSQIDCDAREADLTFLLDKCYDKKNDA